MKAIVTVHHHCSQCFSSHRIQLSKPPPQIMSKKQKTATTLVHVSNAAVTLKSCQGHQTDLSKQHLMTASLIHRSGLDRLPGNANVKGFTMILQSAVHRVFCTTSISKQWCAAVELTCMVGWLLVLRFLASRNWRHDSRSSNSDNAISSGPVIDILPPNTSLNPASTLHYITRYQPELYH